MTSSLPGVKYGAAHYKYLEQDKTNALKISKGCFDAMRILSPQSIIDIQWWYNKISCSKNNITKGEPVIEISSDASSFGWGAVFNNIRTGGACNLDEMEYHINAKELLAAKLSRKTFVKVSDAHVKLLSNNTTTENGINNMHSKKSDLCHSIISEIWTWAEDKKNWITASYIPGKENYDADEESRKKQTEVEWMVNPKVLMKITSKFKIQPEVDLFASRFNAQLPVFVSYHPDPEAMYFNAFSISWQGRPFYAFPSFAVIVKVLHEIVLDVVTEIIVVPNWPTQPWCSLLMKLLIDIPILLRSSKTLLQPPAKSTPHPLANQLNLLASMISGKN